MQIAATNKSFGSVSEYNDLYKQNGGLNELTIAHVIGRSCVSIDKFEEVKLLLDDIMDHVDVLIVSETWFYTNRSS